jgi:signal transduction histidine kinase
MRLLPRSLFARLALTLFAVLLIAQLVALGVQLADRAQVFYRAVGLPLAQRVADVVTRLEALPQEARPQRLRGAGGPRLRLVLRQQPQLDDDTGWRGLLLARMLRRELGTDRELRVAFADTPSEPFVGPMHRPGMGPGSGPGARMHRRMDALGLLPDRGIWIQAEVRLDDGHWLSIERLLPRDALLSPTRLVVSLAVLLSAVLGVSLLAVRWLTRPLAQLADAADTLGRDLDRPPLPETGPDEMRRSARAFNTMQARLQRLVGDRTRLLAAISHDLRTPLTRMRLRVELVHDGDVRERLLGDIDGMARLVDTTLDFAHDTAGDEPLAPLDVDALLGSLQADYEDAGRAFAVSGRAAVPFTGRAGALRRALGNLVDNALVYGGSATVVVDDDPHRLELRVVDRGPGLAGESPERLLEPFQRGEASRSRETGGTGLGLAIARSIARAHGGELMLADRPGGGLVATLVLPR